MDFLSLLRGEPAWITGQQLNALKCADLVNEWPVGVFRLGWLPQQILSQIDLDQPRQHFGMSRVRESCSSGPFHEEAHQLAYECQDASANHSLVLWWTKLLRLQSAVEVVRKPLAISVEYRLPQTLQLTAKSDRFAQARALLEKNLQHIALLDNASPDEGPALWTMTYLLLQEIGKAGLPLDGNSGIAHRTRAFLSRQYEDGYIENLALNGPFNVSSTLDESVHINLDYSGIGSGNPVRGTSLSSTSGMFRGEECWYWRIDPGFVSEKGSSIPLSLAYHLAVLSQIYVSAPGETRPGHNAVVVLGLRKAWLFLKDVIPLSMMGSAKPVWLRITDDGVLEAITAGDLASLFSHVPSPISEPEAGLRWVGELLGTKLEVDTAEFMSPKALRARLRLRTDEPDQDEEFVLAYINKCAKSL